MNMKNFEARLVKAHINTVKIGAQNCKHDCT
jgi:hypothetical protein